MSRPASATRSAASSVAPPAKTAKRANRRCSPASRRSCDHSIVERRRPLARIGVAAAGEQVEALPQSLEDRGRREDLRAGGGQLDREGHLVEGSAESLHGVVGFGIGLRETRACDEELDRVGLGERPHLELDLAADPETLAARREDRNVRTCLDEIGERGRRVDHLLEVVEDEEHLALADVVGEVVLRTERLRDLVGDQGGVADRCKLDPEGAGLVIAHQLRGSLDRQACLAGTARPGERHEPHAARGSTRRRSRPPPRGRRTSWPASAGSCSRSSSAAGTVRHPSWRIRTGSSKSFSRCSPRSSSASPPHLRRSSSRLAEQHLPPVTRGADPRAEMDVLADVALGPEMGRARVDPDADVDPAGAQRLPTLLRGGEGLPRVGEGVEECVALCVDLGASVTPESPAQEPAMLRQRLRIHLSA